MTWRTAFSVSIICLIFFVSVGAKEADVASADGEVSLGTLIDRIQNRIAHGQPVAELQVLLDKIEQRLRSKEYLFDLKTDFTKKCIQALNEVETQLMDKEQARQAAVDQADMDRFRAGIEDNKLTDCLNDILQSQDKVQEFATSIAYERTVRDYSHRQFLEKNDEVQGALEVISTIQSKSIEGVPLSLLEETSKKMEIRDMRLKEIMAALHNKFKDIPTQGNSSDVQSMSTLLGMMADTLTGYHLELQQREIANQKEYQRHIDALVKIQEAENAEYTELREEKKQLELSKFSLLSNAQLKQKEADELTRELRVLRLAKDNRYKECEAERTTIAQHKTSRSGELATIAAIRELISSQLSRLPAHIKNRLDHLSLANSTTNDVSAQMDDELEYIPPGEDSGHGDEDGLPEDEIPLTTTPTTTPPPSTESSPATPTASLPPPSVTEEQPIESLPPSSSPSSTTPTTEQQTETQAGTQTEPSSPSPPPVETPVDTPSSPSPSSPILAPSDSESAASEDPNVFSVSTPVTPPADNISTDEEQPPVDTTPPSSPPPPQVIPPDEQTDQDNRFRQVVNQGMLPILPYVEEEENQYKLNAPPF